MSLDHPLSRPTDTWLLNTWCASLELSASSGLPPTLTSVHLLPSFSLFVRHAVLFLLHAGISWPCSDDGSQPDDLMCLQSFRSNLLQQSTRRGEIEQTRHGLIRTELTVPMMTVPSRCALTRIDIPGSSQCADSCSLSDRAVNP